MKAGEIRFFDPSENSEVKTKKRTKKPATMTGYISSTGKLVLPNKTVDQLGINLDSTSFKIGAQAGKRKAKQLFLLPTNASDSSTFSMEKAAKSYSVALSFILQKNGVDYANQKYTFVIDSYDFDGVAGFSLKLSKPAVKVAKVSTGTGKVGRPKGSGKKVQQ